MGQTSSRSIAGHQQHERERVEHAMGIPEVVSNPLFFGILEGLRTDYSMFEQHPVPRRRSRSPQEDQ